MNLVFIAVSYTHLDVYKRQVIHATRAQNGHSTGYGALRSGLPGYVEPEEGLGIVIQRLWAGDSLDDLALDHFRYAVLCYSDGVYDLSLIHI